MILLLLGLLLTVIALPVSDKKDSSPEVKSSSFFSASSEENTDTKEIEKRRTFAIISHPDAGKTTLTEKFLLYGGAINLAGV